METNTLVALVLACAPHVHHDTARAVVITESNGNPWAIGVVGAALTRQPSSKPEAMRTAAELAAQGHNFSVGLGQINVGNFPRLGLTLDSAFEPCTNLAALQTVLVECLARTATSSPSGPATQHDLHRALSCYYSGNFVTGFRHGYVHRVLQAAASARPISTPPPSRDLK